MFIDAIALTGGGAAPAVGAVILAGTGGGAIGGVAGDYAGQVTKKIFKEGKSFTEAASTYDTDKTVEKAVTGAISGAIGGAIGGTTGKGLEKATKAIKAPIKKTLIETFETNSQEVVKTGVKLGESAAQTTKNLAKVETQFVNSMKNANMKLDQGVKNLTTVVGTVTEVAGNRAATYINNTITSKKTQSYSIITGVTR